MYNSQIWDVEPWLLTSGLDPYGNDVYELRHTLQMSSQGGWRYGFEYGLELEHKHDITGGVDCSSDYFAHFAYKMRVHFPDGSSRLLRLVNGEDAVGDNAGDGFYAYGPDGGRGPCYTRGSDIRGDMRYVTTDGTYAHVTLHRGSGGYWTQRRWTIHFNDGRRVEGRRDRTERLVDRNGNAIEVLRSTCAHEGSSRPCTRLRDDLGREMRIVQLSGGREIVTAPGHGGGLLEWRIERGTVDMSGGTYACGSGPSCAADDAGTIDKIKLPQLAGRQRLEYVFEYHRPASGFGELKKIDFPAPPGAAGGAGSVRYAYKYRRHKAGFTLLENPVTSKTLTYREPLTGTELSETWRYAVDVNNVTTVTAPDGGALKTYFHENKGVAANSVDAWQAGLVWKMVQPNGNKVERYWARNQAYASPAIHASDAGNPYVRAEYRTLGALTAAKLWRRDKNGNLWMAAEYDFGVRAPRGRGGVPNGSPTGTPARAVVNLYTRATPYAERIMDDADGYWRAPLRASAGGSVAPPRLLSLVDYSEVRQGGASGPLKAKTDFGYDARGNVLTAARGIGGVTAKSAYTYDAYGNLTQTRDARGNVVKLTYGAVTGCPGGSASNLYPTRREEAYGLPEERATSYAYDCGSGLLRRWTDNDNSVVTDYGYDRLGRLTEVDEAGLRKRRSAYNDGRRRVYEERDRLVWNDRGLALESRYDPLGRLWPERSNDRAKIVEGGARGGIRVERAYRYGGSNRYELASNAQREGAAVAAEETMGWRRVKYDRNGRVVEAAAFAGAGKPWPWGANGSGMGLVRTYYGNNTVTVRDEAGVARVSTYDGLGRLIRVRENGVRTCYAYDALDNLTEVRQNAAVSGGGACAGGQLRRFAYDALSRLIAATNPESGTVRYSYDGNGNVLTKRDGRGGTVTYSYDGLKRMKTTVYAGGGAGFEATPDVSYVYDAAGASRSCRNKGRLTSVRTSVSATSYGCYDGLGRVTASAQRTAGDTVERTFGYAYNAEGTLRTQTYPSGLRVAYEYDAAGRLKAAGKNAVGAEDYAAQIGYAPHGGLRAMKLGNGLYESRGYNARMQPTAIRLGRTAGGAQPVGVGGRGGG